MLEHFSAIGYWAPEQRTGRQVNEDGMIDYQELNAVLDTLGDTTSEAERREYFNSVDTDNSNGVDYEEFLELVHKVLIGKAEATVGFGRVYTETSSSLFCLLCRFYAFSL